MNITIVGSGYVGLSNAMLLANQHNITILDIIQEKIEKLNQRISPIQDTLIQEYLGTGLSFNATLDKQQAYSNADIIIIATPTNYDEITHYFDTSSIEEVLLDISSFNTKANIIIKSTVPVGFTQKISNQYPKLNIVFSPEFLREGQALFDNLYPSRIVIGKTENFNGNCSEIVALFHNAAMKENIPVIIMRSTEAEAVKLFSNTYLAMRVAYFNELDTYCVTKDLNAKDIIQAISLDPRIGEYYNNPSFGYGGYCLPKDTKQLLANYQDVPQNLISAVISSNDTRKEFISEEIIHRLHNVQGKVVGIYRLVMKNGSDNFRQSAILDIIERLKIQNIEILIYEPRLKTARFSGITVITDLQDFKIKCDIIVANRLRSDLDDVKDKVFTRDLFQEN